MFQLMEGTRSVLFFGYVKSFVKLTSDDPQNTLWEREVICQLIQLLFDSYRLKAGFRGLEHKLVVVLKIRDAIILQPRSINV